MIVSGKVENSMSYCLLIIIVVLRCDYDDVEFDDLETQVKSYCYVQAGNSVLNDRPYGYEPLSPTDSLVLRNPNVFPWENLDGTSSLEESSEFNEPLLPEGQLDESSMDYFDGTFF